MTEKYPLLTAESVKYWYWECNPAYSVMDIGKATGANQATIYRFMERNRIPRRSRSEANLNRFKCEQKREDFVKLMGTRERKENQSKHTTGYWKDPLKRKKMMNGFRNYIENVLGIFQAQILYLLTNSEGMFLSDFIGIIKRDKNILDRSLRALYNRRLVNRKKQLNRNTRNSNALQYYYTITDEGINLLNEKKKEPEYASLIERLGNFMVENNSTIDSLSAYLGKHQRVILHLFQENNSFFLTDLKKLTTLNSDVLDYSLRGLFTRGILSREKESNPVSGNNLKHFKYRLTEFGRKVKVPN